MYTNKKKCIGFIPSLKMFIKLDICIQPTVEIHLKLNIPHIHHISMLWVLTNQRWQIFLFKSGFRTRMWSFFILWVRCSWCLYLSSVHGIHFQCHLIKLQQWELIIWEAVEPQMIVDDIIANTCICCICSKVLNS